jgi:hypothetical protein
MLIENDREEVEELLDDIEFDTDCDLLSCGGRVRPREMLGEVPLIVWDLTNVLPLRGGIGGVEMLESLSVFHSSSSSISSSANFSSSSLNSVPVLCDVEGESSDVLSSEATRERAPKVFFLF